MDGPLSPLELQPAAKSIAKTHAAEITVAFIMHSFLKRFGRKRPEQPFLFLVLVKSQTSSYEYFETSLIIGKILELEEWRKPMIQVRSGLEVLCDEKKNLVRGKRIGLLAHPASVDRSLVHALSRLVNAGAKVELLLGPEHGFGGEAQDMEPVQGVSTGPLGLPLLSLYGATSQTLSPPFEAVSGLDAVVADLMDVGARYYTFIWTAVLTLRVCHAAGVPLILLDRPNPIGGELVEGAPQQAGFESFVGLHRIPNRHGMTPGEIANFAAQIEGTADGLTVVPMEGWRRSMGFAETGLHWVLPSPNMPTVDTAVVYPGMCLLEGTEASEGRGTTKPFEIFGAPGLDPFALARRFESYALDGVRARPVSFKPTFHKHAGRAVGGLELHVTDGRSFRPLLCGVAALCILRGELGRDFAWRHAPYEFVEDIPAIDLLCGNATVRTLVEQGAAPRDIEAIWLPGQKEFEKLRRDFLLYD
jgi:uncharacterized protein YbbC (DUF1343 family)